MLLSRASVDVDWFFSNKGSFISDKDGFDLS